MQLGRKTPRFCSKECFRVTHARTVKLCEWCNEKPIKRGGTKYCSRDCASKAQTCPDRDCAHCANPFKPSRISNLYCSNSCSAGARTKLRVCAQCGKERKGKAQKFCSRACAHLAQRKERKNCESCGQQLTSLTARFCSQLCYGKHTSAQRPPCRVCGKEINRRSVGYCSRECANVVRFPIPKCTVCGADCQRGLKCCSDECRKKVIRAKSQYTDDFMAKLGELLASGQKTRKEIAKEMGLSHGALVGLMFRHKLHNVAPPKPRVTVSKFLPSNPRPSYQRWKTSTQQTQKPQGAIPLPLREVIRLCGEWGINRSSGNWAALVHQLSAAVRSENPNHRGYRLAS